MLTMRAKPPTKGFSLLEVLVALLVFSLGLIGLAGLMLVSAKTNHGAYLRSQAVFLAGNLADRMRANAVGVWQNLYVGDYPVGPNGQTCAQPCTPNQLADHDRDDWSAMLTNLMPNSGANVACARAPDAPALSAQQILSRPPYDGLCTLTVTWSEQNLALGGDNSVQSFTWVFKP